MLSVLLLRKVEIFLDLVYQPRAKLLPLPCIGS